MYTCLMRLKILVVDDDPFLLEILEEFIKGRGHNVFTTTDPEETISLVTSHYNEYNPFDAVFIDYMMPGMDGIELSKKLLLADSSLLLFAITADNSLETKSNISRYSGFSGMINKAADIEGLDHHLNIAMSYKKKKFSGQKSPFLERTKKSYTLIIPGHEERRS